MRGLSLGLGLIFYEKLAGVYYTVRIQYGNE